MIRVFVVDDSAIVRKKLTDELNKYSDIQVVGTAIDPYVARDKMVRLDPDVVTLDVEMPRMDGITFLKKIMQYFPKPVIIVSSLTKRGSELALEAIEAGAVEVMSKPGGSYSVGDLSMQLANVIRAAAKAELQKKRVYAYKQHKQVAEATGEAEIDKKPATGTRISSDKILTIGASTGGTEAIKQLLLGMPADSPGTLIVQHMPPQFTTTFASRLNQLCKMEVKEAQDGDRVFLGRVLIAPGNYHMLLKRRGGEYYVKVKSGPMVHHQRPSVDVLFKSVAANAGRNAIGALLTGMGSDGADGMVKLREAGAITFAQSEESSIVFGMPREAIRRQAVDYIADINEMAGQIMGAFAEMSGKEQS